ncbi:hypothetical protein QCA50_019106 [Cerrena zonata]|uniref:Uncharacterized protein n=1 Tax=Cerrena zonata TaxID=2478898 RepID=A0AAW0FC18_9APHY
MFPFSTPYLAAVQDEVKLPFTCNDISKFYQSPRTRSCIVLSSMPDASRREEILNVNTQTDSRARCLTSAAGLRQLFYRQIIQLDLPPGRFTPSFSSLDTSRW